MALDPSPRAARRAAQHRGRRQRARQSAAIAAGLAAVIGFSAAALPSTVPPAGAATVTSSNLVANPGFETGTTTGWRTNGTDEVLQVVESGHGGLYAGQLTTTTTTTAVLNDNTNTVSSTVSGATYVAQAWIRTTTPPVAGTLKLREVRSGTQIAATRTDFTLSDTAWHSVQVSFPIVAGGDSIDFNLDGYSMPVGDNLFADDISMVSVVPVPSPTTTSASPSPTVTATTTATPSPTGTVSAPTVAYARVASVQSNTGESWADACVRVMSYGFNGCVRYLPAGKRPSWDTQLQALAAKVGNKPIHLQLTAKTHDDAGLADVITHLPAAWKPYFIYNIYQEPEDNLTTSAEQAAYRSWYTDAATVTREYGVSLPWVEWHEYAGNWNLANFTPPAGDFGGVLWSLFEYGEKDRVDQQVSHILSMMATYAPGKPWGLMAGAYTLENAPYTDAQEHAQDSWMMHMYTATQTAGSKNFAWYDEYYPGTGGAAGEARLERNPYALPDMNSLG